MATAVTIAMCGLDNANRILLNKAGIPACMLWLHVALAGKQSTLL